MIDVIKYPLMTKKISTPAKPPQTAPKKPQTSVKQDNRNDGNGAKAINF